MTTFNHCSLSTKDLVHVNLNPIFSHFLIIISRAIQDIALKGVWHWKATLHCKWWSLVSLYGFRVAPWTVGSLERELYVGVVSKKNGGRCQVTRCRDCAETGAICLTVTACIASDYGGIRKHKCLWLRWMKCIKGFHKGNLVCFLLCFVVCRP